jgi:hypothetical protein
LWPGGIFAGTALSQRPSRATWPSKAAWQQLNDAVGGNLVSIDFPLAACGQAAGSPACKDLFENIKNPYYIGDHPGLTQTLGWVDAWTTQPSAYAVAARNTNDIPAAVNFAREHRLRLAIKGGGHSYQGTSNAGMHLGVFILGIAGCCDRNTFSCFKVLLAVRAESDDSIYGNYVDVFRHILFS